MTQIADDPRSVVEIKVVGKSGQISIGKDYAGKPFRLERLTGGRIVLTAVAMVPESQLWTLAEPHRSRIERGLFWAGQTKPRETSVEMLLKRKSKAKAHSRDRR
ncbi:MAG: hypothetical protein ABSA59_20530 [Terriglobia bacterium]|jgi:hypothetical protein